MHKYVCNKTFTEIQIQIQILIMSLRVIALSTKVRGREHFTINSVTRTERLVQLNK